MEWLGLSFVLAFALSMDCFVLALGDGLAYKGLNWKKVIFIAAVFGLFQGLFPLGGYLLGTAFSQWIDLYDHYISFALLLFIGGKMCFEGIKGTIDPLSVGARTFTYKSILLQGVADSIDALAVGVTIGSTISATANWQIYVCFIIIALITFFVSLVGFYGGQGILKLLKGKFHLAEVLGGLILIGLGTYILLEGIGVLA